VQWINSGQWEKFHAFENENQAQWTTPGKRVFSGNGECISGTVIIVPLVNIASFEQKVPHVNPVDAHDARSDCVPLGLPG
jgi:hypothetical protein